MNHHLTQPYQLPLSPLTRLVYIKGTSHHIHTGYTAHAFFFSFHSLSGYTGKADNSTILDSQYACTIFRSFFFSLPASESGHHMGSIGYIIYTHTDMRTMHLHYHMIDSPFIFSLSFPGFPTLVVAKMDNGTAH